MLSIEIKRLHRLLRKMSNHCGELEKALTVKMSPQEDTNSHLNQDYEEELVELNNQVILQNERLVLKDKYIEEQSTKLTYFEENFLKSYKGKRRQPESK